MGNKVIAAVLALAAWAALAAAPASAAELYSGSTKVAAGTEIVGNSEGSVRFEGGSGVPFVCTASQWRADVEANGPKFVLSHVNSFTFSGIGSEGRCQTGFGDARISIATPSCFSADLANWTLENQAICNTGNQQLQLTLEYVAGPKCQYTANRLKFRSDSNNPIKLRVQREQIQWFVREPGSSSICFGALNLSAVYNVSTAGGAAVRVQ